MKHKKLLTILAVVIAVVLAVGTAGADLIGFWNFDDGYAQEGPGGIKDMATDDGSHNGTLVGGTFSTDVPSVLVGGRSIDLTGGDHYVLIDSFLNGASNADFNTGTALSVSVWVKGWPDGGWEPFVAKRGEDNIGWQIRRRSSANDPTLTLRGTSGDDDPATSIAVGPNPGWTHLAATYDGSVRKFYVNGVETHSMADTGTITMDNSLVCLGARDKVGTLQSFSRVMLDDIGIWDNAISAEDVQDLAKGISPVKVAGAEIISPEYGEVVPPGDVILKWANYVDPCSTGPGSVYVEVAWGTDPNRYTGGYTQVVADNDITTATISPAGPGIYYWYVDNTITLANGDPCMLEGRVYKFTNDGPIESVDAGPDMVTWVGQPVDLIADVNDDGGSPLTYLWAVDSLPSGVTAVFDPSADIANTAVAFVKDPYANANIINAGFEADQQDEDGWGTAPGWTQIGRIGNWNPPADAYTNSEVPEGVMCAWAQHNDGGLAQVLTETLAVDTQYELTVEVGNSNRYDWTGYKVQLLAGGTVIAEDDNTLNPALGTFETSTVNYAYTPEDANKVGLPLEIRLLAGSKAAGYAECNFDDVKLTADPPFPAPEGVSSVDITLTVQDETNPAVSDSMTIEVYDDECQAAREGLGLDIPADLNENCLVNPEDLAVMAEKWLNDDKNLDTAVTDSANNWVGNIFSVNFYRAWPGWQDTDAERNAVLLKDVTGTADPAAGFGDWNTTGWYDFNVGWDGDGNDETPDIITSTDGDTASFYLHDTRNGNSYNENLDAMVEGANAVMMEGHGNGTLEDPANPDKIFHIELADIPFDAYDVIFYLGTQEAQQGDGSGKYSFNGGPEKDFQLRTGSITGDKFRFDGTFEQVNKGDGIGNYILIEGVTGSSFNFKMHGTGANHIGMSGFQVRQSDPNAPVVSAGDSMITWLGEPATLTGSIDGTNSLWNMEDTTFTWTVNAMEGLDVTVTDSETLSPTVTIERIIPYLWEIPISDSSFEKTSLTPDGQMKWFMTRPDETSWRFADPEGIAETGTPEGKGYFGQLLLWNPKAGIVHGGGWNKAGMDGIIPDGDNCVIVGSYLRFDGGSSTGSDADARSQVGGLAKLLVADSANGDINAYPNYDPSASYELSANIGHDGLYWDRYYGYRVELLAGGENVRSSDQYTDKVVGGTVIGSVESTDPVDPNTWVLATVSVGPNAANADLAGLPLQIRITSLKDPADPTSGKFIIVDDVKLMTDAPKALEPVIATLTVTEGATGNSTASSAFIDIYENPCDAAVAADPAMEFDLSDLTKDCITNMADFVFLAEDWLLDYAMTKSEEKP